MANKDQIIAKMQDLQSEIEQAVAAMPEGSLVNWHLRGRLERPPDPRAHGVHQRHRRLHTGHGASCRTAPNLGAGYDENTFNAQQVAARESKSIDDLVGEIKANFQRRTSDAVRDAPDDLLSEALAGALGCRGRSRRRHRDVP